MDTTIDPPIPFGDLKAEVREIRDEIDEAVGRVLDRGWFVLGEEVSAFEAEFAAFAGVRVTVSCGNGTDAITLALRALDLGRGDEVITVANTCVPTVAAIRDAGCDVRLVDCNAATLQTDAASLERAISARTRAVVVVHLYGATPNMDEIVRVCRDARVRVVEDCAQAHGASFRGTGAGRWGDLAAWSFYPSKNLGAYGDGGAVTTGDDAVAERLRHLRNYGQSVRYYHDVEGRNSRLDEMQAAILRVKLRHVERWNERRRALADAYTSAFAGSAVRVPDVEPGCRPARHLYPVRVPGALRDSTRTALAARGVSTQIHYPVPIHRQKAYEPMFSGEAFPNAEAAADELVSLPLYPQMADDGPARVADALLSVLEENRD